MPDGGGRTRQKTQVDTWGSNPQFDYSIRAVQLIRLVLLTGHQAVLRVGGDVSKGNEQLILIRKVCPSFIRSRYFTRVCVT